MNQDDRLNLVSEIVRAFAEATTDYDRLLETIAERMAEVLGATCNVQVLADDGMTLHPIAIHATEPAIRDALCALLAAEPSRVHGNALYRQVVESGVAVLIPRVDDADRVRSVGPHASWAASIGVHSVVIVALRVRGRSIGTLSLGRYDPALPPFGEGDRDLAQLLADHAALAISNAQLLRSAAESEQHLSTTVDSIGDGVIATDAEGRIERMNRVAEALTGWPLAEARGRPLAEVFRIHDEATGQPVESPVDAVLREGAVVGLADHTALTARDGAIRPIADSAAPIRDAEGRTHGVVLVFRDKTSDRSAIELAAENRRVQEASRLKSEFLANMSHELRTPLNSILGFGELLHDQEAGPLSPKQQEFVGHMLTSGRHLLQLINDILDLSKVEAGKVDFRPEPIDARAVLDEVVASLRTTALTRGVHLTTRVDHGLDELVIDPARLKQVLYNFLSNALKFTPAGGTVEARIVEDGASGFRIEVEDTGIGIAAKDLPHLFVEFQQLDAGTAKRHAGTGLGLALTRRLVEAQGGKVGVASVPSQGSIFHARLPRRMAVRRTTAPPVARPPLGVAPAPVARVWIVDDDRGSLELMLHTLEPLGFECVCFESAASALERLAVETPRAVVLDLLMPELDGFAFLDRFRSVEGCRSIPVVVWTVKDLSDEEHERLGAAAQVVVAKGSGTGVGVGELFRVLLPDHHGASHG